MKVIALTAKDVAEVFAPRAEDSHKGCFGYVGIIGGSIEYSGAAKLANIAAAAVKSGAGVVRLAVPQGLATAVAPYLLESTLCLLDDDGCGRLRFDKDKTSDALRSLSDVVCGCGLGCTVEVYKTVCEVLKSSVPRKILDADALNALAAFGLEPLYGSGALITPHIREFARLCGNTDAEILTKPADLADDFARRYGVTVLLKGHTTYIADGSRVTALTGGSAGQAKGGSGDVLSGVLCGIAGYTKNLAMVAAAATCVCGIAGVLAAAEQTDISATPSDTVRFLPQAIANIRSDK